MLKQGGFEFKMGEWPRIPLAFRLRKCLAVYRLRTEREFTVTGDSEKSPNNRCSSRECSPAPCGEIVIA